LGDVEEAVGRIDEQFSTSIEEINVSKLLLEGKYTEAIQYTLKLSNVPLLLTILSKTNQGALISTADTPFLMTMAMVSLFI